MTAVRSPEKFLKAILDSNQSQSTLKVLEKEKAETLLEKSKRIDPVSYTHLTLPTNREV